MYYEEEVINGILHYKCNPRDDFTLFSIERLTEMYLEAKEVEKQLLDKLEVIQGDD